VEKKENKQQNQLETTVSKGTKKIKRGFNQPRRGRKKSGEIWRASQWRYAAVFGVKIRQEKGKRGMTEKANFILAH